jgi:hypothetical protein
MRTYFVFLCRTGYGVTTVLEAGQIMPFIQPPDESPRPRFVLTYCIRELVTGDPTYWFRKIPPGITVSSLPSVCNGPSDW